MLLNRFYAIGTYWYIELNQKTRDDEYLRAKVIDSLTDFENLYSRFIDDSLISTLNRFKLLKNPSNELLDIIKLSIEYNNKTDNLFNIAVAHELENLGYDKGYSFIKKRERIILPKLSSVIKYNSNIVELNEIVSIDLGGIGKSYLIKKIAQLLVRNSVSEFIINAGGDIFSTMKTNFYIENPNNPEYFLKEIIDYSGAICTSSINKRSWTFLDKKYTHILHPENKDFKFKYLSCTTLSNDVIEADILSKTIFLSNQTQLERFISKFNIKLLLVDEELNIIEKSNRHN